MREILFRGKRIENDEWVYGSFCMDAVEQKNGLCGVDGFIRLYDFDKGKIQMHEVDRETVGQFTGMTDKNGKKIFEGDIVEYYPDGMVRIPQIGRVEFHDGAFGVMLFEKKGIFLSFAADYCTVIGNIHDNHELLEVK